MRARAAKPRDLVSTMASHTRPNVAAIAIITVTAIVAPLRPPDFFARYSCVPCFVVIEVPSVAADTSMGIVKGLLDTVTVLVETVVGLREVVVGLGVVLGVGLGVGLGVSLGVGLGVEVVIRGDAVVVRGDVVVGLVTVVVLVVVVGLLMIIGGLLVVEVVVDLVVIGLFVEVVVGKVTLVVAVVASDNSVSFPSGVVAISFCVCGNAAVELPRASESNEIPSKSQTSRKSGQQFWVTTQTMLQLHPL